MADPLNPMFSMPSASDLNFNLGQGAPLVAAAPAVPVTQAKKETVARAADLKKIQLNPNYQSNLTDAVAIEEGNLRGKEGYLLDAQTRTPAEMAFLYGPGGTAQQLQLDKYRKYYQDEQTAERSTYDAISDTGTAVGKGLVLGLGSLGTLAAGVVNDRAGQLASEGMEWVGQAADETMSERSQKDDELYRIRRMLDAEDRNTLAEQEAAEAAANGAFDLSALRRIGRAALDTAEDLYENPRMAGKVGAEGVGSLLASFGAAGALKLGAAGMTGLIGAMEAGGAYSDVVSEISKMSEADLNTNSPEYRQMRASGMNHEDAVRELATDKGAIAGMVQGVIGAATGKMVAKFEANPFRVGSLGSAVGNVTKEGVEEAIQEGSAGLTTGLVVSSVDPSVSAVDRAGEGAVLGVVGGVGAAGVTQTPAFIAGTAGAAAKGVGLAGKAAGAVVDRRLGNVSTRLQEASGVAASAIGEAATRASELLAQLESTPAEQQTPELQASVAQVKDVLYAKGNEVNSWPRHLRDMVLNPDQNLPEGNYDRLLFLKELAAETTSTTNADKFSPEEKAKSALFIYEQSQLIEKLGDAAAQTENLTETEIAKLAELRKEASVILSNPAIQKAIDAAQNIKAEDLGAMPEVTEENRDSPEVQAAVRQQLTLATLNPDQVDVAFLDRILNQSQDTEAESQPKTGWLKPEERQVLQAAYETKKILVEMEEETRNIAKELIQQKDAAKSPEQVRDEVLRSGKSANQLSVQGYVSEVAGLLRQGSVKQAQEALYRLRQFGMHMGLKLKAAEQSTKIDDITKNKVPFRTWDGQRWIEATSKEAGRIGITLNSDRSVALGRMVHVEARAIQNAYNSLLKIYGDKLKGESFGRLRTIPAFATRDMITKRPEETEQQKTVRKAKAKIRDLTAKLNKTKNAVSALVLKSGKIRIGSPVAKELEYMGVTPKRKPSWFTEQGGKTSLDNIPADELAGAFGTYAGELSDEAGYVPEGTILEALAREADGEFQPFGENALLMEEIASLEKFIRDTENQEEDQEAERTAARKASEEAAKEAAEKEAAEKAAKQEAERKAKEEAERKAKEEAERKAKEEAAKESRKRVTLTQRPGVPEWIWKKDQAKAAKANKFIGFGSENSSTKLYGQDFGEAANSGSYEKGDTVFVSVEGRRSGRVSIANSEQLHSELEAAIAAGVTFIADAPKDRDGRDYNIGERELAAFLSERGYKEIRPGSWVPAQASEEVDVEIPTESALSVDEDGQVDTTKLMPRAGEEESLFSKTYILSGKLSSIIRQSRPLEMMYNLLVAIRDGQIVPETSFPTTPESTTALGNILGMVDRNLKAWLYSRPRTQLSIVDGAPVSPLDLLKLKPESIEWAKQRSLALVNPQTGQYDPRLIEVALVATAHWLATIDVSRKRNYKEMTESLGLPYGVLTQEELEFLNSGVSSDFALKSLASEIRKFWGAQEKGDMTTSNTQGIILHLASEILIGMTKGILEKETRRLKNVENEYSVFRISSSALKDHRKAVGSSRRLLEHLSVNEPDEPALSFGKPVSAPKMGDRIKGSTRLPGRKMKKALAAHRKMEFRKNKGFIGTLLMLSKAQYMALRGAQRLDKENMNEEHYYAVEGYNQSLSYNWDKLQEYLEELKAQAEKDGVPEEELGIYFDHQMMGNSRIHAQGSNYQSNKLVRETFVHTRAVLDIRDPEGQGSQDFWLTVAQSLGVKTENLLPEEAIAQAKALVAGQYAEAFKAWKEMRASKEKTKEEQDAAVKNLIAAMRKLLRPTGTKKTATRFGAFRLKTRDEGLVTDKFLHAMEAVAAYEEAQKQGGEAAEKFNHNLSLEADGKTDGPANAIGMMDTALLTTEGRERAAKTGVMINSLAKTLAQDIAEKKGRGLKVKDLYGAVADRLSEAIRSQQEMFSESESGPAYTAALRALSHFFTMDMDDEGRLTISRNFTKNPTTIVIYGSGAEGIAGKVVHEIRMMMAELATELIEIRKQPGMENAGFEATSLGMIYPELAEDIGYLTQDPPKKKFQMRKDLFRPGDLKKILFNREQIQNMEAYVLMSVVGPMLNAINAELGGVVENSGKLQAMTQIQGQVLISLFSAAVKRKQAERVAEGKLKKGQLLSKNDYGSIFKELVRFGVVVTDNAGEHVLQVGEKEKAPSDTAVSNSFDESLKAKAQVSQPEKVGVAFGPQFVISRGDAEMMINYFSEEDAITGAVPVFDGLEMRADRIREISEKINKAVYDAWVQNPLRDVQESWVSWLSQAGNVEGDHPLMLLDDYDSLDQIFWSMNKFYPGMRSLFQKMVLGYDESTYVEGAQVRLLLKKMSPEERDANVRRNIGMIRENLEGAVKAMTDWISEYADEMEAVKEVLKSVPVSMDHMASGNKPYVNGVEQVIEGTEDEITLELERRKEEALKAIKEKRREGKIYARVENNAAVEGLVEKIGSRVRGTKGVYSLSAKAIQRMGHEKGVWDAHVSRIMRALAKFLPKETVFYFGSKEELAKLRTKLEGNFTKGLLNNVHGQFDPNTNRIWIVTSSQETVLHEMVHAALNSVLSKFYLENGEGLEDVQKAAIENLEKLMNEFMVLGFDLVNPMLKRMSFKIRREIQRHLDKGTPLGQMNALSEYVAYALSAKPLVDQLKVTRSNSRLKALISKTLEGFRKLFRLASGTPTDMFNLTYANTAAALMPSRHVVKQMQEKGIEPEKGGMEVNPFDAHRILDQRSGAPEKDYDTRLRQMMERLHTRVRKHLEKGLTGRVPGTVEPRQELLRRVAQDASNIYQRAGFVMDEAEAHAFRTIHMALSSGMELNPKSMARLQTLYSHTVNTLVQDDLLPLVTSTGTFAADDTQALMDALLGSKGDVKDAKGRSTLMVSFLALSQAHKGFRDVLATLAPPKNLPVKLNGAQDLDTILSNFAANRMSDLEIAASKAGRGSSTVKAVLDNLADALSEEANEEKLWIEVKSSGLLDTGDKWARGFMDKTGEYISGLADSRMLQEREGALKNMRESLRKSLRGIGNMVRSEDTGLQYGESILALANRVKLPVVMKPLYDLAVEMVGQTDFTKTLYKLVNQSRYLVAKMRQAHREDVPLVLNEQFKEKLSKETWTSLHKVWGETDIVTLLDTMSINDVLELLKNETKLRQEIDKLEAEVRGIYGEGRGRRMVKKAWELARFLATGEIAKSNHNLLKNAFAISLLVGEPGQRKVRDVKVVSEGEQQIDKLVTLQALLLAPVEDRKVAVKVMEEEAEGTKFTLLYLAKLKQTEEKKLADQSTATARVNRWKGFIPAESADRTDLQIRLKSEHEQLIKQGYTFVEDYKGSDYELGERGYYRSNTAGRAPFMQGALQIVQRSVFGVDPRNGISTRGNTAGVLLGKEAVRVRERVLADVQGRSRWNDQSGEPLIPIYDKDQNFLGYERHVLPERLMEFKDQRRLDHMMGAWAGRQEEEALSENFNKEVLTVLANMWKKDKDNAERKADYVNIQLAGDPVWYEAYLMLPRHVRETAAELFDGPMMIRKDMIDNSIGYRMPSVADAWHRQGRWSSEAQKGFRTLAEFFFGASGFSAFVTAERSLQSLVSFAKTTFVVRSIVVPIANMASAYTQLMVLGLTPVQAAKAMVTKIVEANKHLVNLKRLNEIEVLMAGSVGDEKALARLKAEKQAVYDAEKRMSIHPLIEAGEFAAISEGLTEQDETFLRGRYIDRVRELAEKIPEKLGTIGRYAVVSESTALFRGMAKAVQYGDFIAKAALYDHLRAKGKTEEQALYQVRDEFVGYNFLPGRFRSYTDSMGFGWFLTWPIRSVKVALRQIRNHPFRVLLMNVGMGFAPDVPGINLGTLQEDNFISRTLTGDLWRSLGWDMLWRSWTMNPWVNLSQ